jgi:hypothetical protein
LLSSGMSEYGLPLPILFSAELHSSDVHLRHKCKPRNLGSSLLARVETRSNWLQTSVSLRSQVPPGHETQPSLNLEIRYKFLDYLTERYEPVRDSRLFYCFNLRGMLTTQSQPISCSLMNTATLSRNKKWVTSV